MLMTLDEKLDPAWAALVVIDMQNDYIHDEGALGRSGLDVTGIRSIVEPNRQLIAAARNAGVPVVFLRNWHSAASDSEAWLERSIRRYPNGGRAGEAGTWGAAFYEGIEPAAGELVINKTRYDGFLKTDLDETLRARGIRTLVFAGTATNVCVESTVRSAHLRDYYVVVAGNGCAAPDLELHRATLLNVERHFGVVIDADDAVRHWASLAGGAAGAGGTATSPG